MSNKHKGRFNNKLYFTIKEMKYINKATVLVQREMEY